MNDGLLTSHDLSLATALCLTKWYVWSIALYGCETSTLTAELERRLRAFEKNMPRFIEKEKKSNLEIFRKFNFKIDRDNCQEKDKKTQYFIIGHGSLQKRIVEGKVGGKRGRGRTRRTG